MSYMMKSENPNKDRIQFVSDIYECKKCGYKFDVKKAKECANCGSPKKDEVTKEQIFALAP